MAIIRKIIFLLLVIMNFFGLSCTEANQDLIKFKVIGTGHFRGWYILNSGSTIWFDTSISDISITSLGSGYQYEFIWEDDNYTEDFEHIKIVVDRISRTDSLTILIYRESKIVLESKLEAVDIDSTSTTYTMALDVDYNYDDDTTTTTTTDTTD